MKDSGYKRKLENKEPSLLDELRPSNWSFRERLFLIGTLAAWFTGLTIDYLLSHHDQQTPSGVAHSHRYSQTHTPQKSLERSVQESREESVPEPLFANERDGVAYRPIVREAINDYFSDYDFRGHEQELKTGIERLVLSMFIQESRVSHFDENGRVIHSPKGAVGVGQHMRINVQDLGNRGYEFTWRGVQRPRQNAQATVATVRERFRDFNIRPEGDHFKESDLYKVGASYNGGVTRVTEACERSRSTDFEQYLSPRYVGGASGETLPYTRGLVALMAMYDPAQVTDAGILTAHFGPYTDPLHHENGFRYWITFLPAEAGVAGDPVYAPYPGKVVFAGKKREATGYGKYIKLALEGEGIKEGAYVYLMDLDEIKVRRGSKVTAGQQIGTMGDSGIDYVAARLMITFEGQNYRVQTARSNHPRYIDPGLFYAGPSRLATVTEEAPPEIESKESSVMGLPITGITHLIGVAKETPREAWLDGRERVVKECLALRDYSAAIEVYKTMLPVVDNRSPIEEKIRTLEHAYQK
ncbi:M23 family metallopeptidase [Candidatus Woesearchaeota archaeon]|nr:M23 family metallopeptidase [Candidatus Woesearchaeota archaeon]